MVHLDVIAYCGEHTELAITLADRVDKIFIGTMRILRFGSRSYKCMTRIHCSFGQ
jgi:hypothetical protein